MVVQVLAKMNDKYITNLDIVGVMVECNDLGTPNQVFKEEDIHADDGKPDIKYIIPPLGEEVSAFISHVDNNGSFHLQISENLDLIDNVTNILESASHKGLDKIEEGSICCAKYANQDFYRAKIISVDPKSQTCLVKFLDYGDYGTVEFNNVKKLPLDCWTLPAQDIHCVLFSERRQCILEGEKIKNSLISIIDKEISGYFEKGESEVLVLRKGVFNGDSLEDLIIVTGQTNLASVYEQPNDDDKKFDATLLEYKNFNEEASPRNREREIEASISDKGGDTNENSVGPTQHSIAKGTISRRVNDQTNQKSEDFIQGDVVDTTLAEGDGEVSCKSLEKSLLITFVENEGENIWVQDLGEASQLDTLMTEIDEYIRSEGEAFLDPQINDLCICKYSQDNGYYRAKILNIENDIIFIHYIDYGNSDRVSIADVYTIPEKYQKLSPQAFLCKIASLIDCDKACMSAISDYAASAETLTGQVEENQEGKVLFNVFVNGESLENVKNNFLNNIKQLANQSETVLEKIDSTIDEEKFNKVMNHNRKEIEVDTPGKSREYTNKAIDDHTLDAVEKGTISIKVNDETSWKSENFTQENVEDITSMEENEISPKSLEKSLLVTFVENEGENIWVQDLGEASQLDVLMTEIDEYVRTEGETLLDPQINGLCICKFSQDEGYYRAKILSVENNVVLVHYIDYGNSDNVSLADTYKLPEKYQKLPPQAFLCKIAPLINCDKADMSLITSHAASAETLTGQVEENEEGKVLVNVLINGEPLEIVKNNLLSKSMQQLCSINKQPNSFNEEFNAAVNEKDEFNIKVMHQNKEGEGCTLIKANDYITAVDPTLDNVAQVVNIAKENNETSFKAQDVRQSSESLEIVNDNLLSNSMQQLPNINEQPKRVQEEIDATVNEKNELDFKVMHEDKENEGCTPIKTNDYITVDSILGNVTREIIIDKENNDPSLKAQDIIQSSEADITSIEKESEISLETLDKSLLITYVENEGENIWVQDLGEASLLATLMTEIDEYVRTEGETLSDPQVNDLCICKFSQDEDYYRAKVLNVVNDLALVHFIDYGNSDNVSISDMYKIPEKYQKLSPQAFLCKIASLVDCDKADMTVITDYAASADILTAQVEGNILVKVHVNGEPLEHVKDRLLNNSNIHNIVNKNPECDDIEIMQKNKYFNVDEIFPDVDIASCGRDIKVNVPHVDRNIVEEFSESIAVEILDQVNETLYSFIIDKYKDGVKFVVPSVQDELLGSCNVPCTGKDVTSEETQSFIPEMGVFEDCDVYKKDVELMAITGKSIDVEAGEPLCVINIEEENSGKDAPNHELSSYNSVEPSHEDGEETSEYSFNSCNEYDSDMQFLLDDYDFTEEGYGEDGLSGDKTVSHLVNEANENISKSFDCNTEVNSSEMKEQSICKEPLAKDEKIDYSFSEDDVTFLQDLGELSKKEVQEINQENTKRNCIGKESYDVLSSHFEDMNITTKVENEKRQISVEELVLFDYDDEQASQVNQENDEKRQVSIKESILFGDEQYFQVNQENDEKRQVSIKESILFGDEQYFQVNQENDEKRQVSIEEPVLYGDEQSSQVNQQNKSFKKDFTGSDTAAISLKQQLRNEDFENENRKGNSNIVCGLENLPISEKSIFSYPPSYIDDTENLNFEEFSLEVLDDNLFSYESVTNKDNVYLHDNFPSIKDELEYSIPDPFEYQEDSHTGVLLVEQEEVRIELLKNSETTENNLNVSENFEDTHNKSLSRVDTLSEECDDSKTVKDLESCVLSTPDNTRNKFLDNTSLHQAINKYETSNFDELISSNKTIENTVKSSFMVSEDRFHFSAEGRTEQYRSNLKDAKFDIVPALSHICQSMRDENDVLKTRYEEMGVDLKGDQKLKKLQFEKVSRSPQDLDYNYTNEPKINLNNYVYQIEYEGQVPSSKFLAEAEVSEEETISAVEEDLGAKAAFVLCDEVDKYDKLGIVKTVPSDNINISKESSISIIPKERNKEIVISRKENDFNLHESDDFIINAGLGEKSYDYEMRCQVNESESILAKLSTYSREKSSIAFIGSETVQYSVNQNSPWKETEETFVGEEISSACGSKMLLYSNSGEILSDDDQESPIIADTKFAESVPDIDLPEIKDNVIYGKITNITTHGTWVSFWVQNIESLPTVQTIEKEMKATIRKGLTSPKKIEVGQIYCSYFCGDLLRTKLLSVRNENLKVSFIDIGKTCNIIVDNLYDCQPSICHIPAMSKSYNLPVLIPGEKIGKVATLLQERCANQICSYIDVTMFIRSHLIKSHNSFAFVATENVGSVTDFLVERGVANNFTHLDVSYLELVRELNKISISKIKNL